MKNLIDRLICRVLGHSKRQFVRFEYPRFSPWLWTRCQRCRRSFDKEPLEHVSLRELVDNYGVSSSNIGLHYWGRTQLAEKYGFSESPEKNHD